MVSVLFCVRSSVRFMSIPGLAEIIDFGYPQNSETDTLKTYITTESIVSANIAAVWFPLITLRRLHTHG